MIDKLKKTIDALRDPKTGCPWDLKQTHKSLIKYLLEESYELIDTIETDDYEEMKSELGDILLQVYLHAKLAEEKGHFDVYDVFKTLDEKMIRRHPHVFGELKNKDINIEMIKRNWEEIKQVERDKKGTTTTEDKYFYNKKDTFNPALTASLKIGKKSKRVNFDWEDHKQVSYKVEEEWQEVKEELMASKINKERVSEEIGDLLFSVAQLARHLDIDPEQSLHNANKKFVKRFKQVEDFVSQDNKDILSCKQEELETYWNKVKQNEIYC